MKFRMSELFLGAFLTVSIFAMGMLFSSQYSSQAPQKESHAASGGNSAKDLDAELIGTTWLTKDAAGFFTFALVIVGGLQAIMFLAQLRLIRESLTPAKEAADAAKEAAVAAKLNAEAVINADRAHLYVVIQDHNVSGLIDAVADAKFSVAIAKDRMDPPVLAYVFKNYGKTPAIVESVMHCVAFKKDEGGIRTYEPFDRALEIIGEREEIEPIATSFDERPFLAEDAKALGDHDTMLFFYSEVTFRDAFNQRHTVRSDFLYSADRFHLIDRKETNVTQAASLHAGAARRFGMIDQG
jgi:hypothetical protein